MSNATFTKIGETAAAGTSFDNRNYSFKDITTLPEKLIYRLKMIDKDGSFKYSPTIILPENKGQLNIQKILNNPFNDKFGIILTSNKRSYADFIISDVTGKTIQKKIDTIEPGVNYYSFDGLENLPAGIYLFQVISNETLVKTKLVKLK
jgi:hypothetical protein